MSQGRVRYHVLAQTAINPSLLDPANQQFIHDHVSSLGTYSPNPGDGIAKWFPEALAYVDAYSIYTTVKDASGADIPNPLAAQHPEWILKSASGKPLYIPWGAKSTNGQLPQYAGDFSNSGFCGYQIDLGAAKGGHRAAGGLWSRQFDRGAAYLNEPGALPIYFTLARPAYDIDGKVITSISLGPAQGKVIRFDP